MFHLFALSAQDLKYDTSNSIIAQLDADGNTILKRILKKYLSEGVDWTIIIRMIS